MVHVVCTILDSIGKDFEEHILIFLRLRRMLISEHFHYTVEPSQGELPKGEILLKTVILKPLLYTFLTCTCSSQIQYLLTNVDVYSAL